MNTLSERPLEDTVATLYLKRGQEPSIAANAVTLLRETCPVVHVFLSFEVTNPNQVVRARGNLRTCLTALALREERESFTLAHREPPPQHLFIITRQSAKQAASLA